MVEAFGLSEVGPVRKNNEDCLVSDLALNLFVVADGMGGHAAGEVASRLAVEVIEDFVRQSCDGDYFTWPFGLDPSLSFGANRLKTALHLANCRILSLSDTRDDYLGMGTTAVCALLSGPQLTIAHVGDSRLYVFSEGTLVQLTEDDSWAAVAAVGHTQSRHVLTNALGAQTHADVHLCERELAGGEVLLLCTDGLHDSVDHETLLAVLRQGSDLETLGRNLIATAIERGARDNVTALLVRYSRDDA
jgi:protein phosphatase